MAQTYYSAGLEDGREANFAFIEEFGLKASERLKGLTPILAAFESYKSGFRKGLERHIDDLRSQAIKSFAEEREAILQDEKDREEAAKEEK